MLENSAYNAGSNSTLRHRIVWYINGLIYDLLMNDVHKRLFQDVIEAIGDLDGKKIDDIGCGTGEVIQLLPKTADIRGIDYSAAALLRAREKCPSENVTFVEMDFYGQLPDDRKPDKIVACRSLYHHDLTVSMAMIFNQLNESGAAVLIHPKPRVIDFMLPNKGAKRFFNLTQFIKSAPRILSKIFGYPYHLFEAHDFEAAGKKYFKTVDVRDAAYGTHYLIYCEK